jgi:predicted AlkP superfamily pyrophosphatase or phosphodiesterase
MNTNDLYNMISNLVKRLLLTAVIAAPLIVQAQVEFPQRIVADRQNSTAQQQKPYVILISADGFRHDYMKKYQPEHLLKLSAAGVQAESMIPSYPSLTFPNHYTLVTGLYPAHHGLVNNTFYDKSRNDRYSMSAKAKVQDGTWYGGTPLWVLAEQQKMVSASFFWVGSEADVKGVRPTYSYDFTEKFPMAERIQVVKDWLNLPEEKRPHLITFYISEPDHAGHDHGPESPEAAAAVKMVDQAIFELTEVVKTTGLPVNFIFLSDHGMTTVDREHPLSLPKSIDPEKFVVPTSGTTVSIHAKNKRDIKPLYKQLKKEAKDYEVYLKTKIPKKFHYGAKDDKFDRIGDIVLIPTWPRVFSSRTPSPGQHGFDPTRVKDMHATFFAWGPAFKSGLKIPSFENVNVYPLITEILGLQNTEKIDGKKKVLKQVLK